VKERCMVGQAHAWRMVSPSSVPRNFDK
jgi:hypothetical protein